MLESIAIERYEKHLMGKERISLNGSDADKERAAKDIIHYAVAELLGWDAKQTEEHITWDIVKAMKLDNIFKYITFPPDIDLRVDIDYVACLAFPKHTYNAKNQVMRVYRRLLAGEEERFPKKIFEGARGKEKAAILLNEFIATNVSVASIDELYERFSDMPRMNNKFRRAKIFSAARKIYPTPLDYLHNSLSEGDKDDFLYAFYQFKSVEKIAEAELRKSRGLRPDNA